MLQTSHFPYRLIPIPLLFRWLTFLCAFSIAKYCALLCICPRFSRFPHYLGNLISRLLFSRLPYTCRSLFGIPAPLQLFEQKHVIAIGFALRPSVTSHHYFSHPVRRGKTKLIVESSSHTFCTLGATCTVFVCKCKLMIIVVNALSYPWYCLTTDQLFHRRATQTNETNIVNET